MVKVQEVKNKKGEALKTKEGVALKEYFFEVGDLFIPQHNSIISKSHKAEVEENGKKITKTITNHKLVVKVKDYPKAGEEEDIFISLTPSQAKSIQKKLDNPNPEISVINQHLFIAYNYKDSDGNDWVGVGFKNESIKPKSFEDIEKDKELTENTTDTQ